jgi:hypothetical protein
VAYQPAPRHQHSHNASSRGMVGQSSALVKFSSLYSTHALLTLVDACSSLEACFILRSFSRCVHAVQLSSPHLQGVVPACVTTSASSTMQDVRRFGVRISAWYNTSYFTRHQT